MIGEISNHQEDEEKNTIKLSNFELNKEEKEIEFHSDSKNKKIIKNRIWKIHISIGKTLFAYLHFYSKKIKKWDFVFPLQYEGITSMDNKFSGAFFVRFPGILHLHFIYASRDNFFVNLFPFLLIRLLLYLKY